MTYCRFYSCKCLLRYELKTHIIKTCFAGVIGVQDSLFTTYVNLCHISHKENLSNNVQLLEVAISSYILITLVFDSGVMLSGEIRCLSLQGV